MIFDRCDTNEDGSLSKKEVKECLEAYLGEQKERIAAERQHMKNVRKEAWAAFKGARKLNTSGDNKEVDKGELLEYIEEKMKSGHKAQ